MAQNETEASGSDISEIEWSRHPVRGAIMSVLSTDGRPLSFKEISHRTGTPPSLCAYHLKLLSGRGMVERSFEHTPSRRDFSFYRLSGKGERSLEMMSMFARMSGGTSPRPERVLIAVWKNLPRCFLIGGG